MVDKTNGSFEIRTSKFKLLTIFFSFPLLKEKYGYTDKGE